MPPSGTGVPLGEGCTTPYVYDKLVRLSFGFFLSHSVQGTKIDQNIDEGVLIGYGPTIAQSGALNTQFFGLGVDALGSSALLVDSLEEGTVAVELIADASADAGGKSGSTAAFGPVLVTNRADAGRDFREAQGTDVTAALVLEEGGTTSVGVSEGHRQSCFAQRQALGIELTVLSASFRQRDRCKSRFKR